jgi:hypothetical protein
MMDKVLQNNYFKVGYCHRILPEILRKITKYLSQDIRPVSKDFTQKVRKQETHTEFRRKKSWNAAAGETDKGMGG